VRVKMEKVVIARPLKLSDPNPDKPELKIEE
jgi:hypothetical protein